MVYKNALHTMKACLGGMRQWSFCSCMGSKNGQPDASGDSTCRWWAFHGVFLKTTAVVIQLYVPIDT